MVFSGRSVKRMKQNNRAVGTAYEQIAGRFLEKKGFQILEYNYRCRAGEIDLIAARGSEVSFVEVKTRRNDHYGRPCEAVGAQKIYHIRRTAVHYLQEQEMFYDDVRFQCGRSHFGTDQRCVLRKGEQECLQE